MQEKSVEVFLRQINPIVGDIEYNEKKIIEAILNNQVADIIIFPEISLVD